MHDQPTFPRGEERNSTSTRKHISEPCFINGFPGSPSLTISDDLHAPIDGATVNNNILKAWIPFLSGYQWSCIHLPSNQVQWSLLAFSSRRKGVPICFIPIYSLLSPSLQTDLRPKSKFLHRLSYVQHPPGLTVWLFNIPNELASKPSDFSDQPHQICYRNFKASTNINGIGLFVFFCGQKDCFGCILLSSSTTPITLSAKSTAFFHTSRSSKLNFISFESIFLFPIP
jgi:hypothetical protein